MPQGSYTSEGFRAAFRRPSLVFAEITWRWMVGATAAVLSGFALLEYLDTLPVTNGEILFLRTKQPVLIGRVLSHILRGSLNRVVLTGLLVALGLAAIWIVAASIGRALTVRELMKYFADHANATNDSSADASWKVSLRALIRLNFLRVALALAAMCGLVGAAILASFASPAANPQPSLAFFLFLPLGALVGFIWWTLNWFLSLASLLAVREGDDALGAISAAVALCRERAGAVFAVGAWTGLAHVAAFAGAMIVLSMSLGLTALGIWRLVVAGMILILLLYFSVADWLYMARLAGYVSILEMPDVLLVPAPPAPTPPGGQCLSAERTIDFAEPILSDLPDLPART
ncbi:MAG: hypothetical protein WB729_18840 [Candidatus Sulfotelmatobacter sp.]